MTQPSADDFYRARDSRTNMCVPNAPYAHASIRVSIDEAEASHPDGQIAQLTLVNLMARWARRISFEIPNVPTAVRSLGGDRRGLSLPDAAEATARDADPFGEFVRRDNGEPSIRIHVGTNAPPGALFPCVAAVGWH
jgi:hypothetical protein